MPEVDVSCQLTGLCPQQEESDPTFQVSHPLASLGFKAKIKMLEGSRQPVIPENPNGVINAHMHVPRRTTYGTKSATVSQPGSIHAALFAFFEQSPKQKGDVAPCPHSCLQCAGCVRYVACSTSPHRGDPTKSRRVQPPAVDRATDSARS